MATSRARTDELQRTTAVLLRRDVERAAGDNALLSKTEQAAAPDHVQSAAAQLRRDGGSGARVGTAALNALLSDRASQLIASVNQKVGVGRAFFSKAEARAATQEDPALGARVMKAWELVTGRAADVDGLAEAQVRGFADVDQVFRVFSSVAEAERYQHPRGRSVVWLVKTAQDEDKTSFAWGRNDLWAQRFDVDARTGAFVVTGEH